MSHQLSLSPWKRWVPHQLLPEHSLLCLLFSFEEQGRCPHTSCPRSCRQWGEDSALLSQGSGTGWYSRSILCCPTGRRWNWYLGLPLSVPRQSATVPLRKAPECFSVSSEGCILPSHQDRQNQHFPVVLHGFKTTPKAQMSPQSLRTAVLWLHICISLNFSFPLRSQHPFSWQGLQFWGAENRWIFKMRKHPEVLSDGNLHSRVLLQESCCPDVPRLYKFKLQN